MDIKNINNINDNIKNCHRFNYYLIKFSPENESIDTFIKSIKEFGNIEINEEKDDDEEERRRKIKRKKRLAN